MNGGTLDGCSLGRVMFNVVMVAGSDYFYTQQRFRAAGISVRDPALERLILLSCELALEWSKFEPGDSQSAAEEYIAFVGENKSGPLSLIVKEVIDGNVSVLEFTDVAQMRFRLASPVVPTEFMREACRDYGDFIPEFRKQLASRYAKSFPPSDTPAPSDLI